MVVLRTSVRAVSVPVGEPPSIFDSNLAAQQSLWFSKAAINDAEDLSSASKRHDQDFLRDVNDKIVNSHLAHPITNVIKRNYVNSSLPRKSVPRSTSHFTHVVRTDMSPSNVDDSSIDYEVQLMTPVTTRLIQSNRASSLPPPSAIYSTGAGGGSGGYPSTSTLKWIGGEGHHPKYYVTDPVILAPDRQRSFYDLHVSPSSTSYYGQKFTPTSDLAVRQAHQNLDRIERELKSSSDDIDLTIRNRSPSPGPGRRFLYRSNEGSGVAPRRHSVSFHGPRSNIGVITTRSPSPAASIHHLISSNSPGSVRKYPHPIGLHLRSNSTSTALNKEINDSLLMQPIPSDIYHRYSTSSPSTHLPSTLLLTKRYVNPSTQILLDQQLNGPDDFRLPSSVLAKKLIGWQAPAAVSVNTWQTPLGISTVHGLYAPGSLLTSIHNISSVHKPPAVPKKVYIPPPAAASLPQISGLPQVTRPRVSETRKKVRDVLCKVKGDPHYFD